MELNTTHVTSLGWGVGPACQREGASVCVCVCTVFLITCISFQGPFFKKGGWWLEDPCLIIECLPVLVYYRYVSHCNRNENPWQFTNFFQINFCHNLKGNHPPFTPNEKKNPPQSPISHRLLVKIRIVLQVAN